MRIDGPLENAVFLERPNRFLTIVRLNGRREESHLPDPGRLRELLVPEAKLKIRPAPGGSLGHRKTAWTTVMVKTGRQWVSIDSTLPNRFVKSLLEENQLPMFDEYELIRSEVKNGDHRFDFLLEKDGAPLFLEVKSVTLVEKGAAMFPDAVTQRGRRHMNALAQLSRNGAGAAVLFVCQRSDVQQFRPQWERDPRFAHALANAEQAGVFVSVISALVSPDAIEFEKIIPYDLTPA